MANRSNRHFAMRKWRMLCHVAVRYQNAMAKTITTESVAYDALIAIKKFQTTF